MSALATRCCLRSRSVVVVASAALVLGVLGHARADVPTLAGHRFVPSTLVASPFVLTEVASTSTTGSTDLVLEPDLRLPAGTLLSGIATVDGRFVSASQSISGAVAFGGIFAIDAGVTATGLLPRTTATSLVLGAHAAIGGHAGAALRLVRAGPFQLTLRADFDRLQTESIVPLRLPRSLRVVGDIWGVRPALAAALALTPRVGLQGSFTVDWRRYDVDTRDDVTGIAGGLAATISLDPAPLTLMAAGDVTHDFGRDVFTPTADAVLGPELTSWNVEGGLYITSVRALDLGFLFTAQLAGGADNQSEEGEFRLGYYF